MKGMHKNQINQLHIQNNCEKAIISRNPPWWNRRTYLEKCLLCGIIGLVLIFIIVLSLYVVALTKVDKTQNVVVELSPNICLNSSCIRSALNVIDYIDTSTDPCTDFYQFACGGFLKKSFIAEDETSVSSFTTITETVDRRLLDILEEASNTNEPKPFTLLKKFYASCMNLSGIENEGFETLTQKVLRNLGGWPVLESKYWEEDAFDWNTFMYKARKLGLYINFFLYVGLEIDKRNSSKRIIMVDEVPLEFSKESFIKGFEDEQIQSYYHYMVDVAVILGADRLSASVELKKAVEFEIELAKLCYSINELRNASISYDPSTIADLQINYPGIRWLDFLNNIINTPDVTITKDTIIDIGNPEYIKEFIKLIRQTPKRIQANYAMFKVVGFAVPYLTEELREREQEYNKAIYGVKEEHRRWKNCINIVTSDFNLAAGALYVRKHFDKSAKNKIVEIATDIRVEFYNRLKEIEWMDNETRSKALEKAQAMTFHIAYADELFDDEKIEEHYSGLNINFNSYFSSVLDVRLYKTNKMWAKLNKKIEKLDWASHVSPITINAFYSPDKNEIELPAGILQGILFDSKRPQYMNFGSMGFMVGHEITHGFDDLGKEYDKNGNLHDWWAKDTEKAFMERAQCIIDQYQRMIVSELNMTINGVSTQGENIADNGAVNFAYKAYEAWVNRHGEEPLLPGLNYTQKQLFWISAGNMWCRKIMSKELKQDMLNDFHPPNNFRVEIPLSNSKYFSQDFNCPLESKMNPKKKCQVW